MALKSIDVLIADDHRLTRGLVADMLGALRATIRRVEDGAEAFDEIIRQPPHLVITDLHMPIDGITLLHNVRRSVKSPDPTLPVIVMTSMTDQKTVASLRDAGAHAVMCKPLSAKVVLGRVASVIDFPREFVCTPRYVGPCRRRTVKKSYDGPRRRSSDQGHGAIALL